jgi:hypothetical protein
MTPLKSRNNFASPYLLLKRIFSKNISWVNIPKLYKYPYRYVLKAKKGILNFIFDFSGVSDTAETDFADFLSDFSWQIRSHIRNGIKPLIRDLGGVN